MDEKVQSEDGISLLDIMKLLLGKIKLLILVLLIGGVLGGCFAVWKTINVNYYGTTVEFYVNPEKPKDSSANNGSQYGVYGAYGRHVMDNMVKLLASESFTEMLLLNGEPLPIAEDWVKTEDEKKLDLATKVAQAKEKLNFANGKRALAEKEASEAAVCLETLCEEWDKADLGSKYNNYSYSDLYYERILNTDSDLLTKHPDLEAAYHSYNTARNEAVAAENVAVKAEEEAEALVDTALVAWRKTAEYKKQLKAYGGAVSYTYLGDDDDAEDANNLARSFIYVKIKVLNDQAFAETLLESVKNVVPEYIEANMAVPSDYTGTNCKRITRDDSIQLTNPGYTKSQAIKYAVLAAAVAFIVACVIIIVVDRSDTRLRDTDVIASKFNVPVLGVIPSIEELSVVGKQNKRKNK